MKIYRKKKGKIRAEIFGSTSNNNIDEVQVSSLRIQSAKMNTQQ